MMKLTAALILLAGCAKSPGHCSATVTGTGTSADGPYTCQVPPNGFYSPSTQNGGIQGFATSTNGLILTFDISTKGEPTPGTYTEVASSGAVTSVVISSSGSTILWEAGSPTGDGPVAIEVTALNTKSSVQTSEIWPLVSGNLNAKLKPSQGNAATTSATVSMTF